MTQTSTITDSIRYITVRDSDGFTLDINPETWAKLIHNRIPIDTDNLAKIMWILAYDYGMLTSHANQYTIEAECDNDFAQQFAADTTIELYNHNDITTIAHDLEIRMQTIANADKDLEPKTTFEKLAFSIGLDECNLSLR